MHALDAQGRLRGLTRPRGPETRVLLIGEYAVRLEGLDPALAACLERRWGAAFLVRGAPGPTRLLLRVLDAGARGWLPPAKPGERYRVESLGAAAGGLVVSYHFALAADGEPGAWRVGLSAPSPEPLERSLENAVRFLVARAVAEDGGLALHAAGVVREGRAFLLAGASGSGKTTAVAQCRPAADLGDDFGLVVPATRGWCSAAVPFDNSERIVHAPPRGLLPLAGIWRLHQASTTRVERPSALAGVASLVACAAFAWALPDLAERLLVAGRRLVDDGLYAHLHFALGDDLWTHLVPKRVDA
jgi:hypothetical protein